MKIWEKIVSIVFFIISWAILLNISKSIWPTYCTFCCDFFLWPVTTHNYILTSLHKVTLTNYTRKFIKWSGFKYCVKCDTSMHPIYLAFKFVIKVRIYTFLCRVQLGVLQLQVKSLYKLCHYLHPGIDLLDVGLDVPSIHQLSWQTIYPAPDFEFILHVRLHRITH